MAAIEQLTPLVQRIVVAKGGPYSRFAANAYVVGTGARATLVDTGTGDASSLEAALSQLRASNRVIADVVLTHAHGGHANGLMLLRKHGFEGSVRKLKGPGDSASAPSKKTSTFSTAFSHEAEKVAGNPRGELRFVADGDSFTAADGSTAFKVFHTPGHSEDSICLLLQQEQLLFSGDAISSLPTPSIHTLIENLDQYTSSLKRLTALGPRIILPGHGPVITDGLSYLAEAEALHSTRIPAFLLHHLRAHPGATTTTLTAALAAAHPSDFAPSLLVLRGTVKQHLLLLERAARVRRVQPPRDEKASVSEDQRRQTGPGGLTFDAIFDAVKDARAKDWRHSRENGTSAGAAKEKEAEFRLREQMHPAHLWIPLSSEVGWTAS